MPTAAQLPSTILELVILRLVLEAKKRKIRFIFDRLQFHEKIIKTFLTKEFKNTKSSKLLPNGLGPFCGVASDAFVVVVVGGALVVVASVVVVVGTVDVSLSTLIMFETVVMGKAVVVVVF